MPFWLHSFCGWLEGLGSVHRLTTSVGWLSLILLTRPKLVRNRCIIDFGGVWVSWCFTSHATILQSYKWRHRCEGGLKKKLYRRSGFQRHRHFAGFANMPVLHRHGTTFLYGDSDTIPHSVAFNDTLGIRRTYSRLKPPGVLTEGWFLVAVLLHYQTFLWSHCFLELSVSLWAFVIWLRQISPFFSHT